MEITIRKAKPQDAVSYANLRNLGLKTKFFIYTGSNKPWDKKT